MEAPILSVVMPVYNGERFLSQTLESILTQTFTDFELLVIDDGSTDSTPQILDAVCQRDSRVRIVRNETNIGITRSMNKLFKMPRGKYVNRHDADDLSIPERYAQQVAFLEANPQIGLVASFVEIVDGQGNPLDLHLYEGALDNEGIQQELLSHCTLCQSSVMFRRALLDSVGLYDEALEPAEDYDLWLRMAEATALARLPERISKYRLHSSSISHKRAGIQYRCVAQALEKTVARRFGGQPPPAIRDQIARDYLNAAEKFCRAGETANVADCLVKALTYQPAFFEARDVFIPIPEIEGWLEFAQTVFRTAPAFPNKARVQRRFMARLRMKEVFGATGATRLAVVDQHLWPALQDDPRWLLNRGVIALATRSIGRRLSRGANA